MFFTKTVKPMCYHKVEYLEYGCHISYKQNKYPFRYDNIWYKSWKVTDEDGNRLFDYERLKDLGNIESSGENNLLLLSGFCKLYKLMLFNELE